MTQNQQSCVEETEAWIQSFVIGLNLCPFAKHVFDNGSLRIQASDAETTEAARVDLIHELQFLDEHPEVSTTLILFPKMLHDFYEYLDFVDQAHSRILDVTYEGIYQLATFHPEYCFADVTSHDVTNYTNRSPYPMLHLLREEQVSAGIAYYGNTEEIPENNMACLRTLGLDTVKKMLKLN